MGDNKCKVSIRDYVFDKECMKHSRDQGVHRIKTRDNKVLKVKVVDLELDWLYANNLCLSAHATEWLHIHSKTYSTK